MKQKVHEVSNEAVVAFRKEDPKFCEFLEETSRIVIVEEKGEQHEGSNKN